MRDQSLHLLHQHRHRCRQRCPQSFKAASYVSNERLPCFLLLFKSFELLHLTVTPTTAVPQEKLASKRTTHLYSATEWGPWFVWRLPALTFSLDLLCKATRLLFSSPHPLHPSTSALNRLWDCLRTINATCFCVVLFICKHPHRSKTVIQIHLN